MLPRGRGPPRLRPAGALAGLHNGGATCYMNSVLQQLFMQPIVRRLVLRAPPVPREEQADSLFHQMQVLFAHLALGAEPAFLPDGLWAAYKDYDGAPINIREHQDAYEFFTRLQDAVDEHLRARGQPRAIHTAMGGKFAQVITVVGRPQYRSQRDEEFYQISLDVRGKRSLAESLRSFFTLELMDGQNQYSCEELGEMVDAEKRVLIAELPHALVFHLKRFEWDHETYQRSKVKDRFEFPQELDMRPYTLEAAEEGAGAPARPPAYYAYRLRGVVVHSGSAFAGHYYSYIRDRDPAGGWHCFDDTAVEGWDPSPRELEQQCFGGRYVPKGGAQEFDRPNSAYMLFYERDEDPALACTPSQVLPAPLPPPTQQQQQPPADAAAAALAAAAAAGAPAGAEAGDVGGGPAPMSTESGELPATAAPAAPAPAAQEGPAQAAAGATPMLVSPLPSAALEAPAQAAPAQAAPAAGAAAADAAAAPAPGQQELQGRGEGAAAAAVVSIGSAGLVAPYGMPPGIYLPTLCHNLRLVATMHGAGSEYLSLVLGLMRAAAEGAAAGARKAPRTHPSSSPGGHGRAEGGPGGGGEGAGPSCVLMRLASRRTGDLTAVLAQVSRFCLDYAARVAARGPMDLLRSLCLQGEPQRSSKPDAQPTVGGPLHTAAKRSASVAVALLEHLGDEELGPPAWQMLMLPQRTSRVWLSTLAAECFDAVSRAHGRDDGGAAAVAAAALEALFRCVAPLTSGKPNSKLEQAVELVWAVSAFWHHLLVAHLGAVLRLVSQVALLWAKDVDEEARASSSLGTQALEVLSRLLRRYTFDPYLLDRGQRRKPGAPAAGGGPGPNPYRFTHSREPMPREVWDWLYADAPASLRSLLMVQQVKGPTAFELFAYLMYQNARMRTAWSTALLQHIGADARDWEDLAPELPVLIPLCTLRDREGGARATELLEGPLSTGAADGLLADGLLAMLYARKENRVRRLLLLRLVLAIYQAYPQEVVRAMHHAHADMLPWAQGFLRKWAQDLADPSGKVVTTYEEAVMLAEAESNERGLLSIDDMTEVLDELVAEVGNRPSSRGEEEEDAEAAAPGGEAEMAEAGPSDAWPPAYASPQQEEALPLVAAAQQAHITVAGPGDDPEVVEILSTTDDEEKEN